MNITVVYGDERTKTVIGLLSECGFKCDSFHKSKKELISAIKNADVVILPMPCSRNGLLNAPEIDEPITLDEVFNSARKGMLVLGGYLPENKIGAVDYAVREDVLVKNAIPTAEGAIEIAMKEMKTTLHGSNAVVVGFGRIGSYLSSTLKSLGASVTVAARNSSARSLALLLGIKAVPFESLADELAKADVVFNTVPSIVIGERELSSLKLGAPVIDLASNLGGVDRELAEKNHIRLIHALALPAKVAPETAGKIVFESIASIFAEKGVTP